MSNNSTPSWDEACRLLSTVQPTNTLLPSDPAYHRARYGLWSKQQSELLPRCIFQPTTARDVAFAVTTAKQFDCPFAIKSGGHASFAGASSTHGGILIDLEKLDRIELTADRTAVHIGPGNRWLGVYTALEPLGLTVIGGRDSDVGVGGFLLGGGISFYSSWHGWACDNVEAFEVVLANGCIITASPTDHPDLYRALRGGGPICGIVTDFKLRTFPYRGMWGGQLAHEYSQSDRLLREYIRYGQQSEGDPKFSLILNFGNLNGVWYYANDIQYCAPLSNAKDVEMIRPWLEIPSIKDTTGTITHQCEHTVDLTSRTPRNWRNSFWALSTKLNFDIAKFFVQTFVAVSERLATQVNDLRCAFDMQVITTGMLKNMEKDGGNVLGISAAKGPLLLYNPVPRWPDPADDTKVYQAMETIINMTVQRARELGVENDFLYMNYASQFQDVISSYGRENVRFLREVSRRYDPEETFLRLQGKTFRFNGAMVKSSAVHRGALL